MRPFSKAVNLAVAQGDLQTPGSLNLGTQCGTVLALLVFIMLIKVRQEDRLTVSVKQVAGTPGRIYG